MIHGGAGTSKTTTTQNFAKDYQSKSDGWIRAKPTVFIIQVSPSMRTVTSVLHAINDAMGRAGAPYRNDTVVSQILSGIVQGDLFVFDESQNLDTKSLDQIRYFNDQAGVGVVYMGNDEIHARINGRGRRADYLGPLSSRIAMRLPIPHPTEEDASTIIEAWHVTNDLAIEHLQKVGCGPGGLRALTNVLRQSAMLANNANMAINGDVVLTIIGNLGYLY
jgi:DNA transposition AAA+ family ATPase